MSKVDGWVTSALPDLLEQMKSGGTPDTSRSDFYGGDIPFVSIEDMTACGKALKKTKKKITDAGLENSNCWLVPSHSILYSIYATIGMPRINLIPVTTNQAILALQNKEEKIDNEYLFYWLESIRPRVLNLASQTTQSNLNATTVKGFVVFHPAALQEQSKIAEILSTVDQAIEQTEALIAKQQRIKTGLMQDLLTRGIDEHGQLRTEQTHAFKDSPLGRIPVEWEVYPLSSLVDELITYGIVQAGPHIEGGIPYIRTGDMSGDEIVKSSLLCTSVAIASAFERSRVNEGDIVFSLRANVGKVLPIDEELAGSNLTQGTAKISPNAEVVSAFLIHALRGEMVQDQLRLVEKGTTFMEITLTDLRSIKVAFAVDELEQKNIAKCLDACHSVSEQNTKELGKLKSLKASLMQDLLTGRKRVTDLLEPATA